VTDARFRSGAAWNYGAFGIQALVGLAINVFLFVRAGAEALGVFNQLYAIFVVSGQIVVFALHDSAQKHVAEFADHSPERDSIAAAALALALASGVLGALVLMAAAPLIGRLNDSAHLIGGVRILAPGLLLFVTNKVLMGILNGRRRMIAFAIGQALRALTILGVCLAVVHLDASLDRLALCFTLAETLLLAYLLLVRPLTIGAVDGAKVRDWLIRHASFGGRGVVNSCLSEAFIRIDILMLGIFLPDDQVGVYSFAAFFIEGLYTIGITLRVVINPMLVRLIADHERAELRTLARKVGALSLALTLLVGGAVMLVFPLLSMVADPTLVGDAHTLLAILACGLVVYAPVLPFDYILLQAGRPGAQSIFMALTTGANIVLNAVLIPAHGLLGGAVATAVSFALSAVVLYAATALLLKMRGGIFVLADAPVK